MTNADALLARTRERIAMILAGARTAISQLPRRGCQYELGGKKALPRDFRFCGKSSEGAWCEEHRALIYVKPPDEKRRMKT